LLIADELDDAGPRKSRATPIERDTWWWYLEFSESLFIYFNKRKFIFVTY